VCVSDEARTSSRDEYGNLHLKQFKDLGLAEPILRAVTAEGYDNPTPIQAGVIPAMMAGEDIVGIAQTGTGKTAAFTLPLLNQISKQERGPESKTCRALILAPTRELAAQIAESIRTYGKFMRHTVTVVVGGVKPNPQIRALARGVDIVVATPGRLLDHMSTGAIRLDKTTTIVLDEADQMLDLGFVPAIRKVMAQIPRERQTLLLSATMPKQIRRLASDFLREPTEIAVAPASRPIDRIEQSVIFAEKPAKRRMLTDILSAEDVDRAIVFTRTKHGADKVTKDLVKAGLHAAAIHGNKSQNQRMKTLAAFKAGQTNILVATDIAARGIDIDDVSHVVNFELPNIPESYVHRIGRTARAGKSGVAISLCDGEEKAYLYDIEKLIGARIHRKKADGTLDTFANQIAETESINGHAASSEDGPVKPKKKRNSRRKPHGSGKANGRTHQGEGGNKPNRPGQRQGQRPGQKSGQRQGQRPGNRSSGQGSRSQGASNAGSRSNG
jgi:ATP-dependent RNA helicase RhlE